MANIKISNVSIKGIAACVPSNIEENRDINLYGKEEIGRVIAQSGIERKHKFGEYGATTSDLCGRAYQKLLADLKWESDSIDVLGFVTLTPDYLEPPTGCVMHGKLGLSSKCLTIDLSQGCLGWIHGILTLSSIISSGSLKRAILLSGDTASLMRSPFDKEALPFFGDAGVATALEFEEGAFGFEFDLGTSGKDYKAIFRPHGGYRFPIGEDSLKYKNYGEHVKRRDIDVFMDGMDVFAFAFANAPKSVKNLCDVYNIDLTAIDYFLVSQSNLYLEEKIRKRLKISEEKTPYSLKDYGNTTGSSIPITIVTQCREKFVTSRLDNIACAFGVGLSYGSMHFISDHIVCPKIIYYE